MSTVARVQFYAPSLTDSNAITTALEYAADGRLDATVYGNRIPDAIALLAAHWLVAQAASSDDLARGPLSSEGLGDASRGYASMLTGALSDDELRTTRPGQMLLALRASRATVSFAVLT